MKAGGPADHVGVMLQLNRISCATIAFMEFVVGQVGFEADASWHAPVLQQRAATPYERCPAPRFYQANIILHRERPES